MNPGSLFRSRIISSALWLIPVILPATPVEVAPSFSGDVQQPQVAIDEAGVVHVAFGRGEEFFVASSPDNGTHFEPPRRVARLPSLALGMRRGPRIAVSGRSLTVTAMNFDDLFAYHSADAGRTWSAPLKINSVAGSTKEGLSDLASGPDGRCYATWLDLRSGQMEVYGALSRDGGRTWGANELVYRSPEGSVCECCHVSAEFNLRGDLVVMWRNALGGARDLWAATRPAGSDRFGAAVKQGTGTWKLAACPMDGGAVFAATEGGFANVWRRDRAVYLSLVPTKEQLLGPGTQPLGVSTRGNIHVWWQQGRSLMHATSAKSYAAEIFAKEATYAAAATSPKNGSVVVVYERQVGTRKAIFAEVID